MEYSLERDFIRNRALKIRGKVGEIKLHIWIHQQGDVKGLIRCPFCGGEKDASARNWLLIQVDGTSEKYIACKECEGLDGKYKY